MYRITTIVFLSAYSFLAQASLAFKKELLDPNHWITYALVLLILFLLLLFLHRHTPRKGLINNSKKQLLKVISIQYKTKAYIIEYEGQCFLIADNQNAIAIHELKNGAPSHEH